MGPLFCYLGVAFRTRYARIIALRCWCIADCECVRTRPIYVSGDAAAHPLYFVLDTLHQSSTAISRRSTTKPAYVAGVPCLKFRSEANKLPVNAVFMSFWPSRRPVLLTVTIQVFGTPYFRDRRNIRSFFTAFSSHLGRRKDTVVASPRRGSL